MKVGKVINGDGFVVETVAYTSNSIYMYELQKGEKLIKVEIPADILKPRWNGKSWEETATEEELGEYNKSKENTDTDSDIITVEDLTQQIEKLEQELKAKESSDKVKMLALLEINNRIRDLEGKL